MKIIKITPHDGAPIVQGPYPEPIAEALYKEYEVKGFFNGKLLDKIELIEDSDFVNKGLDGKPLYGVPTDTNLSNIKWVGDYIAEEKAKGKFQPVTKYGPGEGITQDGKLGLFNTKEHAWLNSIRSNAHNKSANEALEGAKIFEQMKEDGVAEEFINTVKELNKYLTAVDADFHEAGVNIQFICPVTFKAFMLATDDLGKTFKLFQDNHEVSLEGDLLENIKAATGNAEANESIEAVESTDPAKEAEELWAKASDKEEDILARKKAFKELEKIVDEYPMLLEEYPQEKAYALVDDINKDAEKLLFPHKADEDASKVLESAVKADASMEDLAEIVEYDKKENPNDEKKNVEAIVDAIENK